MLVLCERQDTLEAGRSLTVAALNGLRSGYVLGMLIREASIFFCEGSRGDSAMHR